MSRNATLDGDLQMMWQRGDVLKQHVPVLADKEVAAAAPETRVL
jgi:hypothetical protein